MIKSFFFSSRERARAAHRMVWASAPLGGRSRRGRPRPLVGARPPGFEGGHGRQPPVAGHAAGGQACGHRDARGQGARCRVSIWLIQFVKAMGTRKLGARSRTHISWDPSAACSSSCLPVCDLCSCSMAWRPCSSAEPSWCDIIGRRLAPASARPPVQSS